MKYILITLITFYQIFLSPLLKSFLGVQRACKYPVTCSEYAKRAIQISGIIKGCSLSIRRLLSCQPFGTIEQC